MAGREISGVEHPPLTLPSREGDSGLVSGEGDFFQDRFDHTVGIGEDFVVPEANDAIAMRFDNLRSISVLLRRMLPAVAFNGEAQAPAGEVDDEVTNLMLAGKLNAELLRTQARPQSFFRFGRFVSKFAREATQSLFRQSRTPIPNPFPQGKGLLIASRA